MGEPTSGSELTVARARALVVVADSTTMAEAALTLQVSESQVRRRVGELSAVLFGPQAPRLFETVRDHRTAGRGELKLTTAGERVIRYARRFSADAEDLLAQARPTERLPLLACYPAHVRKVVAKAYVAAESEFEILEVDDVFRAGEGEVLFDDLRHGRVDALIGPAGQMHDDLDTHRLYQWHLVAVFKKGSKRKWVAKDVLVAADLLSTPLLVSPRSHTSHRVLEGIFGGIGHGGLIAYESRSTETLLALADEGAGVAVMPSDAVWERTRQRTILPLDPERTTRWHALYWRHGEERLNPRLGTLILAMQTAAEAT